ncbi:chloride channel protein [Kitasatospora paracochleata]|uniref:H+/Cl- antiporter ClcA n=1 Tax=Kitasatospora paracochleata TaxID=58354 RepID=A0ABT1J1W2_9ACTN|nr:chloride channel protein [Kitasatospora paracochleata]MCP2311407.1 H+/Cl- antiporter ClcA [Kitasatospora paracochleata]
MATGPAVDSATPPPDPFTIVRNRGYLVVLVVSALLGVPISAAAFGFLALVSEVQSLVYNDLPKAVGFSSTPDWWAVPMLAVAGVVVALTVRHLPGHGGHEPAEGLKTGDTPSFAIVPGVALAAVASLCLGVVLGPEAPLIAIGAGLAVGALRLLKRDAPTSAVAVVGAAGSFAAISELLGSPLLGAFLLMEASGLSGPMLGVVLVPGLLAAGVGSLIFTGLGSWTGLGTYSLTLHQVPQADRPSLSEFAWAILVGVAAAFLGEAVRRTALRLKSHVERHRLPLTVLAGVLVGVTALIWTVLSDKPLSGVLYSGESTLGPLLADQAAYSAGTLVLLVVCKSLAYCLSLSAFRGGPVFPSLFIGGAGGLAVSHLPGVDTTTGFAIGVGAMSVAMLRLPMTSVLLATLLLGAQGLTVMPLVIVSVVISYVLTLRITRPPSADPPAQPGTGAPPRTG